MVCPVRDVTTKMFVGDVISPVQKKENLTIQKKHPIVLACKWSGQGINEYVQNHNEALPTGGMLLSTRALGGWLHADDTQFWKEFLEQATEEEKRTSVRIPNYFRAVKSAEAIRPKGYYDAWDQDRSDDL